MAEAYAEAAAAAGHEVRRIDVAKLEFPLLRTQEDFETGALPPDLEQAREDMRWAEHWVFLFPFGMECWRPCSRAFSSTSLGRALR
ncbi:NAD(P)H-dependent oxidoreductase [Sinorhizobium meliloti]|uniref:NAD(P)H-dependent oxidoreductase n=1 Tax=Rhizobium meliloti TaxID=382 RepID=UPI001F37B6E6|nr:NAD(P)H-dependent oxidoreductase [Sinorhizobium meliloti]